MSNAPLETLIFDHQLLEERAYWLDRLRDHRVGFSGLPSDDPCPAMLSGQCDRVGLELSGETYQRLSQLARHKPFLIYAALMSALKICLYKYTGSSRISVGSPARRLPGDSSAAVNAVAVVDEVSAGTSFRQFLLDVRQTLLEAYRRQRYPIQRLVKDLELPEKPGMCPLFDVALILEDIHGPMPPIGHRVTIALAGESDRLRGEIIYNTDLFERESIARFAGGFARLLAAGLEDKDRSIRDLCVLGKTERERLLSEFNDTETAHPTNACAHQLFEKQASESADALAVACGSRQLTYGQLNAQANRLAHYLCGLGVGPESLVAICAERSLEMVVGLLGILKAGGAYLPIDPNYPPHRSALMMADSRARIVLTTTQLAKSLRADDCRVVCLDGEWPKIEQESAANPVGRATAGDLAYVIYTSGSTGEPKGVKIPHTGLVNLIAWHRREYGVSPSDRATLLAGVGFDASAWELWPYLAAGASLHIPDALVLSAPGKLVEWLTTEAITLCFLPTPLAEVVVEEPWPENVALRALLTGGDRLHRGPRQKLPFRLVNHYGPTENSVVTTAGPVAPATSDRRSPPIGRPIANVRVYILDRDLNPVPIGASGELYIGGAGLAHGYLHCPDLTAERFIPDCFSPEAGARLFKTGDVVRFLRDGEVEFLGRLDRQVQIRGFRVELGEIEVALAAYPSVSEAAVVAHGDPLGSVRLVGYVVPSPGAAPSLRELRQFIQGRLPDYMVPSILVPLESIPLTAHGKVDHDALPVPDSSRPELAGQYVAPRTATERLLAEIWAEVLGLDRVGVDDNFFELGGHSLLATQVVSRVRGQFRAELPLRRLFEATTVAKLATLIEESETREVQMAGPPITPVPRDGELPLSFAQERLWFLDQLTPENPFYNVSSAVRIRGRLDVGALRQSMHRIVARHEALRTTFPTVDGRPVQRIAAELEIQVPVVDLETLAEDHREAEVRRHASRETELPFDLAGGPLLRSKLLRLGETEHVFLLTVHHIVSDGWSAGVALQELAVLYPAFAAGECPELPELPVQYADYAVWQRRWLSGAVLQRQLCFWEEQLRFAPEVLALPTDRPRPAVQTFGGDHLDLMLARELADRLRDVGRGQDATLFMTLLAAWQTLLGRYSGQDEICVGTPIAGRNRMEIEGLIGFFINTVVLRGDLSGDPTFEALLRRTRDTTLAAYDHQDLPFERLVDHLQPQRGLATTPLFQVMLVLQNAPMPSPPLGELVSEPMATENRTSKFDLTLFVAETDRGLLTRWEYSTDLFDAATIERMHEHFSMLLEAIAADPTRRLSQLPLIGPEERRRVLVEFNQTEADYPRQSCIHELFERQVERTPGNVAVRFGDGSLSYEALNRRANRVAHRLQREETGPERLVGICLGRSLQMAVAVLGALKSGRAYVPLDPHYPADRLQMLVEETGVQVVLTEGRWLERLSGLFDRAICLDREDPDWTELPEENLPGTADPEDLAYVVYTSGSTGRPKGVMSHHRGVVNYLSYLAETYALGPGDVVLQVASLPFDASVRDLVAPLTVGAEVIIADEDAVKAPAALLELIERHGVRCVLSFVPTMFGKLVEEARSREATIDSVRLILVSGEALPLGTCAQARGVFGDGALQVNQYGPTECTMTTTFWPVVAQGDGESIAPIGRPIPNSRAYVLSDRLEPCPIGVPGQLHIAGEGLARGYFRRPEWTAGQFIPDPLSDGPGARLYRTGDLCRWLPDGNLEFLGRIDHQVKVRGFRIEPAEVEAALSCHAQVQQAVVVARRDGVGSQQLVAYVVARDEPPAVDQLQSFLRGNLPSYMVPGHFVILDRLPLTRSGKTDRRALPAPSGLRPALRRAYVAPRTTLERDLAEIWAAVLQVERVGIHDNFFALGGHSLLAVRVASEIRRQLVVELPLRHLFEEPTVANLAALIEQARQEDSAQAGPPLERIDRTGDLPLSFAQERLWFLDQWEPNSPFYNIPAAVRVSGRLNEEALCRSLNEVVARHEVLRTTFAAVDGRPSQRIAPELEVELIVTDLSRLGQAEREAEARRLVTEDSRRPFDLSRGPLLRASLLRLGETDHIFVLAIHHIVSDAWSMAVFVRELAVFYEAFSAGHVASLPPLPVQYADYAAWQRNWLADETHDRQLDFWDRQLASAPEALNLPTDRPRPAIQTFHGGAYRFPLPAELSASLLELSRAHGATLFMTLLAAFHALLSRYCRQEQICVGTPVAGRNRAEIEGLIGLFVNTLVLPADLSGNPSFAELLDRVRETTLAAFAHADLPFERLVTHFQPRRDPSRNPLFQVMFTSLQQVPLPKIELPDLCFAPVDVDDGTSKFDLTMSVTETDSGLDGLIRYNTDLFDASTIRRLAGHYRRMLEAVAADPMRPLAEVPLLSAEEQGQVLVTFNSTRTEPPAQKCLHHLFEAQVGRTPEAVALECENTRLTYKELNEQANQLAHYLRGLGVGSEALVGVCLERSAQLVAAILAILKAGGTYLPLDPNYPTQRLAFLLEDSRAPFLLTRRKLVHDLGGYSGRMVCPDDESEQIARAARTNPACETSPEDIAYVIYTSGSTGRPKGVRVAHRAIAYHCDYARRYFELDAGDRSLQFASFSFDASLEQTFMALISGATLVVRGEELWPAETFWQKVADLGLTVIDLPPAYFHQWAAAAARRPRDDQGDVLRLVIVGGDALPLEAVRLWYRTASEAIRLVNAYGPTEGTIASTALEIVPAEVDKLPATVPIGRAMAGTQTYVLDAWLQPVPIGVPGELYVGRDALAAGYLHRADLTAEKFVPNPFSDDPGGRLYKTGDLCRWLPEGDLDFLGRIDQQLKIRGFRIEPAEIETMLARHPAVRETVVSPFVNQRGERGLAAYIVGTTDSFPGVEQLRSYLRQRLPDYMIPSVFVPMDALPLSTSGKVDRAALPAPDAARPELAAAYVAPRTPTEQLLVEIWAEVLGIERVGVNDNFFDLGGHSLLAAQVASRVRERFEVEFPVRSLFEQPTVATLARLIEDAATEARYTGAGPIERADRRGDLPLSFAQQRLWFLYQLRPDDPAYNILGAVRLTGRLHVDALRRTLNEIVARHEVLRTTFFAVDGSPLQRIAQRLQIDLPVVDLSKLSAAEREADAQKRIAEEAARPFDLSTGPLMRASLIRLSDREHVFLLTLHHIVSDAWSSAVAMRELMALYPALAAGEPSPLPDLTVQYVDYAVWQRRCLPGEVLARQLAYWEKQLAGVPETLNLPTDRPRPLVQTSHGRQYDCCWSAETTAQLRQLSRQNGATLFMTLLATFQTLLARYTGQDQICVGVLVAGRNRRQLEELIGFFVNTLVMRGDLSGNPTFEEFLRRVRETALDAYAHQDLPFERLVDHLRLRRDPSRSPLVQVLFTTLPMIPVSGVKLPDLELSPVEAEGCTAKFDLTVSMAETEAGLSASWQYNTDLFDASTIERMAGHFAALVEAAVADPRQRVFDIPLEAVGDGKPSEPAVSSRKRDERERFDFGAGP